ncbi:hypothetical protein F7018_02205 [Tenacibaculum aiptasiae]|uniref:LTD domain-containing protein n=1 Tax=Tenacibaculum aiptasiae TaxID=426481 RepID=A0A7J5AUX5_9FLAO|nr:DUF5689 domain-containing protein [Tenacibaculum aiptasiae]KAB1160710.1 hypothetical protein F7018_02205 [Tenacibaculum aiptasiae]
MKNLTLYRIFAILFVAISFSSCVKDGDFVIPSAGEDKQYTNLKSLKEITDLYTGGVLDFDEYIKTSGDTEINTYGYVISNDRAGNFYKTLIIQDEIVNPTVGLEVRIDATNLNAMYNVGRKVYIKLNGLSLSKYFTTFQIGVKNAAGTGTDRIKDTDYINHIDRSSEIAELIPTNLKIGEITDNHINTLVKIDDLQSEQKGLTYADPNSTFSVNRTFKSCATFESIIMRTSGFSDFKSLPIPDKKGSVTAVLNKFSSDYQLFIRDTKDVDFTQEYGCFNNPTLKTLADVKALFTGSETTITESYKIKVVITSDLAKSNISNRNAFAQDASAAIALRFSEAYNLNIGDEVEIAVGGLKLSEYNGLLQLNLSNSDIISKTAGTLPTPEVITFAQALTGDYESKLVTIEGVQFKDITKTYSGSNLLTSDCTNELTTYVRSDATFATTNVSDKKGAITGIMSDFNGPQIYIRDASDVNFTEAYACGSTGGGTGPVDLFFSEYAEGSSNNKYLEIYNPSTETVDLTKYAFPSVSNAPSTVGQHEFWNEFSPGATIAPGGVYIIAHPSANAAILAKANQTHTYLSNGDDGYALVYGSESSYTVLDWLGDFNGDPGSGWEVAGVANATKDHTLVRKSSVMKGNTSWSASAGTDAANSEWEVKAQDDFSSLGVR